MRAPKARLPSAASLVNVGGDGNDFAVFMGAMMRAIGANVRLANGCSRNATLLGPEASTVGAATQVCQVGLEVRLGRQPARIVSWARSWLSGSKWVGKTYHYRLDGEGYAWLNLDHVDSRRIQRPGAPYKQYDTQTIYHPDQLMWEVEGDELDSAGLPRHKFSPMHSVSVGLR